MMGYSRCPMGTGSMPSARTGFMRIGAGIGGGDGPARIADITTQLAGLQAALLGDEGVEEVDLFLALTNDDENNIMAASLAKRMGCKRVVALINRHIYADLVQGGPIDIAISPAQVSIGALLAKVRRGDVAQVHSLRRGAAEALEIVAHGDKQNSKVIGRRIGDLPIIRGAYIGAIVRDLDKYEDIRYTGMEMQKQKGHVVIAHKDVVIQPDDHVIIFCQNKKVVKKVEQLFAVAVSFL